MKITVNPDRSVKKEYGENEINDGSQNENRVTTISFEVPEDYSDFTKRIVFITKDGNYFDEIANDEYVLKNNITKYKKLAAFVWLINTTTHQDFRSEVFPLEFNYNENFSDSVPSEQEMSQIEILFDQLEALIAEVESIDNLTYEIVEELPTEDIDPHVIYMILKEESEPNNVYNEWMYINEEWELIGTTAIDLQPLQKEIDEINEMLFTHTTAESVNNEVSLNGNPNLEMNVTELDGRTEQDSTEGDNFANLNGMNTTTNNGVTFTINKENGLTKSVKINGTSVNYDSYCIGTAYLLKAGTYTIYGNGITNDIVLQIVNDTQTAQLGYAGMNDNTMTLAQDTNVIIRLRVAVGKTIDNVEIKPMIAITSGKDYEPYTGGQASPNPSYPQEINSVTGNQDVVVSGKNLFKPVLSIDGTDITQANCSITLNEDEFTFVASGSDMYFGNVIATGSSYANERGIKIYRNGNEKISYKCTNNLFAKNYICAFDSDGISLGYSGTLSYEGTYTFPNNCEYITFRFGKGDAVSGTTYKTKVILAYGDEIPDYEPYITPTSYQLSLGDIELAQIGNYKDKIYPSGGKWYLHKEVGKAVLDGTEEWTMTQTAAGYRFRIDGTGIKATLNSAAVPELYCNRLLPASLDTIWLNGGNCMGSFSNNSGTIVVCLTDLTINTVDKFKTFLGNNNLIAYFQLATVTDTEITGTLKEELDAIQKLQQLNGTTIVEIQGNLSADFKLVYENDSISDLNTKVASLESGKENKSNKKTSISSTSTDDDYPSGKAVYTYVNGIVGNINSLLDALNGTSV